MLTCDCSVPRTNLVYGVDLYGVRGFRFKEVIILEHKHQCGGRCILSCMECGGRIHDCSVSAVLRRMDEGSDTGIQTPEEGLSCIGPTNRHEWIYNRQTGAQPAAQSIAAMALLSRASFGSERSSWRDSAALFSEYAAEQEQQVLGRSRQLRREDR